MKRFLLFIFLIIPLLNLNSAITNITSVETYQNNKVLVSNWKNSGSGYWNQNNGIWIYNDFDFKIMRSSTTDVNGYYTYYMYFLSQSYYWDGSNASYTSTNIKYIDLYVDGNWILRNYNDLGITFYDSYSPNSLTFKSKKSNVYIYFTWKNMKGI